MANFDELFAIDNLRKSLVRADAVEAWAPKLFPLEALPGCTVFVRRALLCLCRNGQVLYLETSTVGARFFRRKRWFGHFSELGRPNPAPRGFMVAKGLRVYDVRNRSFVVAIDGCPKIMFFTGITKDRGLPKGTGFTRNIPQAGILIGWVESAVVRARNPHSARLGREATEAWRSVLAGKTDPATLPLLYDVSHPPV
jgi:hypothetical protein